MQCTAYFQYEPTTLYRVVFATRLVRCAALVLFIFFTIQPASQAFAAEDTQTVEETDLSADSQDAASQDIAQPPMETNSQESDAVPTSSVDEDSVSVLGGTDNSADSPVEDAPESQTDTTQTTDEVINTEATVQESEIATEESDGGLPEVPTEEAVVTFMDTEDANMQDYTQTLEVFATSSTTTVMDTQTSATTISTTTKAGTSTTTVETQMDSASTSTGSVGNELFASATSTQAEAGSAQTETSAESATVQDTSTQSSIASDDVGSTESPQPIDTDEKQSQVDDLATTTENTTDRTEDLEVSVNDFEDVAATTDEQVATSSSPEKEVQVVYVTAPLVNDQNRNQFAADECVFVGDGAYYCSKKTGSETDVINKTVLSAPDSDGDQEIFFNPGDGKLQQVTFNTVDDTAPEYDALSNSIVWQRLINDRYQIVTYDIKTGEETVLTNTDVNNMEPSREGDSIVWQRWYENNWEIVLYRNGREEILTDNNVPDIAPDIENGYIIWRQGTANSTKVLVYEMESGTTSVINDSEGGQVVNPRFVLVYDTKYDNGDIVTKGYDPATGSVVPLSAQPAEKPIDLPDADPTGETRALIGNKSAGREELSLELQESKTQDTVGDQSTNTELTHASGTPDIGAEVSGSDVGVTTVDMTQATNTPDILPLTDFDLIVEPYATNTTEQTVKGSASSTIEVN